MQLCQDGALHMLRGIRLLFPNVIAFLFLKIEFVLANSIYAAFHLGLHCLPKYLFRGFQYTKG